MRPIAVRRDRRRRQGQRERKTAVQPEAPHPGLAGRRRSAQSDAVRGLAARDEVLRQYQPSDPATAVLDSRPAVPRRRVRPQVPVGPTDARQNIRNQPRTHRRRKTEVIVAEYQPTVYLYTFPYLSQYVLSRHLNRVIQIHKYTYSYVEAQSL